MSSTQWDGKQFVAEFIHMEWSRLSFIDSGIFGIKNGKFVEKILIDFLSIINLNRLIDFLIGEFEILYFRLNCVKLNFFSF
jgi:hypothetical protein